MNNKKYFEAELIVDALAELYRLDRPRGGSNFKNAWSSSKRRRLESYYEDAGLNLLILRRCPSQFNTMSYVVLQRKRYECKLKVVQAMMADKAKRDANLSKEEADVLKDQITNKVKDAEMILKNVIEAVRVPKMGTEQYQNSYQFDPLEELCAYLSLLCHYIRFNQFYPGMDRQSALGEVIAGLDSFKKAAEDLKAYATMLLAVAKYQAERIPYSDFKDGMKEALILANDVKLKSMIAFNLAIVNYSELQDHNDRAIDLQEEGELAQYANSKQAEEERRKERIQERLEEKQRRRLARELDF